MSELVSYKVGLTQLSAAFVWERPVIQTVFSERSRVYMHFYEIDVMYLK